MSTLSQYSGSTNLGTSEAGTPMACRMAAWDTRLPVLATVLVFLDLPCVFVCVCRMRVCRMRVCV
jgi:hypothetical protein